MQQHRLRTTRLLKSKPDFLKYFQNEYLNLQSSVRFERVKWVLDNVEHGNDKNDCFECMTHHGRCMGGEEWCVA
jgi:hypothetical protein